MRYTVAVKETTLMPHALTVEILSWEGQEWFYWKAFWKVIIISSVQFVLLTFILAKWYHMASQNISDHLERFVACCGPIQYLNQSCAIVNAVAINKLLRTVNKNTIHDTYAIGCRTLHWFFTMLPIQWHKWWQFASRHFPPDQIPAVSHQSHAPTAGNFTTLIFLSTTLLTTTMNLLL